MNSFFARFDISRLYSDFWKTFFFFELLPSYVRLKWLYINTEMNITYIKFDFGLQMKKKIKNLYILFCKFWMEIDNIFPHFNL